MEKLTIQDLKNKMSKLDLWKADYILREISLEEAVQVQEELKENFREVRLWGYPKESNFGTYGWTVEV